MRSTATANRDVGILLDDRMPEYKIFLDNLRKEMEDKGLEFNEDGINAYLSDNFPESKYVPFGYDYLLFTDINGSPSDLSETGVIILGTSIPLYYTSQILGHCCSEERFIYNLKERYGRLLPSDFDYPKNSGDILYTDWNVTYD